MLGNGKRLFSIFLFKVWKFKTISKKVIIRSIQTTQGLLKGLRVRLFEPNSIGLLFKFGQHLCCIVIAKTLFFMSLVRNIVVYSLTEKVIVNKAGLTKTGRKSFLLFYCWIQAILERFVYGFKHIYNIYRYHVNVKDYLKGGKQFLSQINQGVFLPEFL